LVAKVGPPGGDLFQNQDHTPEGRGQSLGMLHIWGAVWYHTRSNYSGTAVHHLRERMKVPSMTVR